MHVLLDTCSIVNLINGDVFDKIFALNNYTFYFGPIVQEECYKESIQADTIEHALTSLGLNLLGDIDLAEYRIYKTKYNLGDGETESIILARGSQMALASDDKKARNCAEIEIGKPRVIGSIFLLRELVRQNIIDCDDSLLSLIIMQTKGGFLPVKGKDYLCT